MSGVLDMLQRLTTAGVLTPIDVHFAVALTELSPDEEPSVVLAAALTSRAVRNGHVCLDLPRALSTTLIDVEGQPVPWPIEGHSTHRWALELSTSPLVSMGERATPLVFDGGARVYLARYFHYQRTLAERLAARVDARPEAVDTERLRSGLDRLLPMEGDGFVAHPQQRLAALVAVLRGLTVISGGPGTGKTTTVLRILALLQEQAIGQGRPPLRIRLLAPTGKAAARLVESIEAGRAALPCEPAVRDAIPREASTIHRALGYRPGAPTQFRHNADDPLPADVVLVDEASMVDLALMAKLMEAVPPHARVILLGDKNQLASVEAGAILGDICNAGGAHGYSRAFAEQIEQRVGPDFAPPAHGPDRAGIWDCIVELTHSYRFSAEGGIGGLARAIGRGDAQAVLAELGAPMDPDAAYAPDGEGPDVALIELTNADDPGIGLRPGVVRGLSPMLREGDPMARLSALTAFRVLAPHRKGRFGIERLTTSIESTLEAAGLLRTVEPFYDGRPIMVTKNDYQLDLFNGDVGIIGRGSDGRPRTFFALPDGGQRTLSPHRLPPHETVFAMTVHKSQGSEFDRIALVIPPAVSPILTRELLYTAVTRAKRRVVVHGSPQVIAEAVGRQIDRASGLRERLWG